MKRFARKLTAWLLVVLMFSNLVVFAENAEKDSEELQPTYEEIIESVAKNIALFTRYEDIMTEDLYLVAIAELIGDDPELYDRAVRAMVESVDENSAYFNKEETKQFMESLSDEVIGIGVNVLFQEGNIVVSQPIPDSPAEKAGIKAGDIIIAADDVDLREMSFEAALEYIRGKEGTHVTVSVMRSGMPQAMKFTVVREKITSPSLDLEIIEKDDKKIARIIVYSFTENVAEQFETALSKIDEQNITRLIIDLRNNGGGYLEQAVAIADMLLPKDKLITTEEHKIKLLNKKYVSTGAGRSYETVVLINEMSASASEVLTAALMENDAATVIGEKSFGKGTVQGMYDVNNDAMMKFTVAYYLTPLGNNIHQVGITPHGIVKNPTKPVDMSQFDFFSYTKKFKVGDKDKEIENAKKMLEELGLFIGEVNEIFDENLKIAITTFQQAKGLYAYGVLDFTTQQNLYDTLENLQVEIDEQLQAAIDAF